MVKGGLEKVRPEIQIHFNSPSEVEKLKYEDTFTEELPTIEEVKQKHGTVVWCKYVKCKWNRRTKGLQRTTGTILNNRTYKPLNEQEHIWPTYCGREEIAIKFDEIRSAGGTKIKVPSCFSAVSGVSGHMDWSRLLQSDGTPYGGNIDSQHVSDAGYHFGDSNSIYNYPNDSTLR